MPSPVVLIVLDGWGYSESSKFNAIHSAKTPVWDRLWSDCPHRLIHTSGKAVGLPDGQMGNSEVGHMTLGAGRVIRQTMTRINNSIASGEFAKNQALCDAIDQSVAQDTGLHFLGLLSDGGVHSHEEHIFHAIELAGARGAKHIYLHAFLDGRDTPPRSALASLQKAQKCLNKVNGQLVSMTGRYYAMDRDKRWDRTELAYQLLSESRVAHLADNPEQGLSMAYERGEDDEFIKPTRIGAGACIKDGDVVIGMNFRADRIRQITQALLVDDFAGFERKVKVQPSAFVSLTKYAPDLNTKIAYPAEMPVNVMGEWLAKQGLSQLRLAETEKYAHVTFFFNGGREEPFEKENRILIDSPKVSTYDLQPEMSAAEVTDQLVNAITAGEHEFIICNYANGDMVGHTGIFDAAVRAVETLDDCLGRVCDALKQTQGQCLITADHGNVECMHNNATDQPHTAHTTDPVPLVYVGEKNLAFAEHPDASLADIAPTLLLLGGVSVPDDMEGQMLLKTQKVA